MLYPLLEQYDIDFKKAIAYGFSRNESGFELKKELPDAGLYAVFAIAGKRFEVNVFDAYTDEEYLPFNVADNITGFVTGIREQVETLVQEIKEKCLLKANMNDHRNDCIVTTFTLISVLLTLKGIYWFDSLTGIGISIWIGFTGFSFFIESYNVLMDISVDDKTKDLILDIVNSYQDIKEVQSISSSPVGYKYVIVIVICVDGNMSTFDSHSLADSVERSVSKLENVYKTIVHVEPV